MSDNMLNDLFGGMGGDLFADFGTPVKKETKKEEKPKAEKKAEKKTSAKKADNKAKETKFTFPVTIRGRNFAIKLTGEGEVDLQALIEKLVNDAHLVELKHSKVRFAKMSDGEVQVIYDSLSGTDDGIGVELPVIIADGQLQAEYTENTQLELEEDDEPSIAELRKSGMNDEDREGLLLDYDATSGIALPVYQVLPEKDAAKSIQVGDRLLVGGEVKTVENTSSIIPDYLGEIPEGWGIEYRKLKDGFYYLGLKPEGKMIGSLISIDRTPFGVKAEKKAEPKKEMVNLPVEVITQCPRVRATIEPKDFDGREKVSFDDLDELLHKQFPVIGSRKPSDHVYNPAENLLEISYTSGKKGTR